jgi:hypothetical protein
VQGAEVGRTVPSRGGLVKGFCRVLRRLPFMNGEHSQLCRVGGTKIRCEGGREKKMGKSECMPAFVAFWRAEENLSTRFWKPEGHGGSETQGKEGLHATLCL